MVRTTTQLTRGASQPLRVGDHVALRIAGDTRHVVVVEDRGPLGLDGGQIVAVRDLEADDGERFEIRAARLERLAA